MKNIYFFISLLILSLFLGISINEFLFPKIITDINGSNVINLKFTFINKTGVLRIKAYNEFNNLMLDEQKTISIKNSKSTDTGKAFYLVDSYSLSVPFIESHKIELEFSNQDNSDGVMILINEISANYHNVKTSYFLKKVHSDSDFQFGSKNGVDGTFVKSDTSKIVFDVTDSLNLPKITISELTQFNNDQQELKYLFDLFLTLLLFLINYLLFIKFYKIDNSSNTKYSYYHLSLYTIITSLILINTSYLINFKDALAFANHEQSFLNHIIFEHNFIPLLSLIYIFIIASYLTKNKFLKFLIILPALSITTVILVDNCILTVLGTRLNFRMGNNFSLQLSYLYDFIIKYMTTKSGLAMIFGACIVSILCLLSFFINNCRAKFAIPFVFILFIISLCGIYPRNSLNNDFNFENPFQINGWCIDKVGDFERRYSENYPHRNNLDLLWNEENGLNHKQNVIIVLVESWGCSFTYACGIGPSYMPNIESLTKNNLFFDNYYSIMPSTSMSYLSVIKGVPAIQFAWDDNGDMYQNSNQDNPLKDNNLLYNNNDLIKTFKLNGYTTRFISSTDLVFQMDTVLKFSSYDEIIDAKSKIFNKIKKRGTFNSVNDEQLFDSILSLTQNESSPYLYITKTASNHAPYNSPLGFHNIEKAFEYTDKAIYNFISKLKGTGFFDNGILVLLGDHHAWGEDQIDPSHAGEPTYINRVPLLIIDGKSNGIINHTNFSHASLGVLLQYLELPKFKKHKFNINPLTDEKSEIIFGYDFERLSLMHVKHNDKQATIVMNGDDSYFVDKNVFSEEEMNDILGYIATFRR